MNKFGMRVCVGGWPFSEFIRLDNFMSIEIIFPVFCFFPTKQWNLYRFSVSFDFTTSHEKMFFLDQIYFENWISLNEKVIFFEKSDFYSKKSIFFFKKKNGRNKPCQSFQ